MLYHYLPDLTDLHIVFNLFRFITFRAAGGIGDFFVDRICLRTEYDQNAKEFWDWAGSED